MTRGDLRKSLPPFVFLVKSDLKFPAFISISSCFDGICCFERFVITGREGEYSLNNPHPFLLIESMRIYSGVKFSAFIPSMEQAISLNILPVGYLLVFAVSSNSSKLSASFAACFILFSSPSPLPYVFLSAEASAHLR